MLARPPAGSGTYKDIARMGIAMNKTVKEYLLSKAVDSRLDDRIRRQALCPDGITVGHWKRSKHIHQSRRFRSLQLCALHYNTTVMTGPQRFDAWLMHTPVASPFMTGWPPLTPPTRQGSTSMGRQQHTFNSIDPLHGHDSFCSQLFVNQRNVHTVIRRVCESLFGPLCILHFIHEIKFAGNCPAYVVNRPVHGNQWHSVSVIEVVHKPRFPTRSSTGRYMAICRFQLSVVPVLISKSHA